MPPEYLAFLQELAARLAAPVNVYFDAVEAASRQTGFLRGITSRLAVLRARQAVERTLIDAIQQGHLVSAVMGNGGQPLTEAQNAIVMQRIAESQRYLAGFFVALPSMTRAEALARIRSYTAAVAQTSSEMASYGKPALPIKPGSRELDCNGYCRCYLDWRKVPGDGNWDVFWLVDPEAEHCDSCIKLAEAWNPLRVRAGRIVDNVAFTKYSHEYYHRMAVMMGGVAHAH